MKTVLCLTSHRYKLLILLALIMGSTASVGLISARFIYTGQPNHLSLIWNLFLAWLPLLFAFLFYRAYLANPRLKPWALIHGFLWLIFLPNAPYLVTNLYYLSHDSLVPLWFDLIMLLSFAWTGLFLGLISLYLMQEIVMHAFGKAAGWVFAFITLGLTSFGIYLGRFLRWNSWDIFLNPTALLNDVLDRLLHPLAYRNTFVISFLFTVLFAFTYLILFALTRVTQEKVVLREV